MNNQNNEGKFLLQEILNAKIYAHADLRGNQELASAKNIYGTVDFYKLENGNVVVATIHNLPQTQTNIYGFHIHELGACLDDFSSAGGHYGEDAHPNHKGDMPVLFSNNGDAFLVFFTDRFNMDEIIGRTVIIHENPDDFTTQPSGNSGARIACGVIVKN